MEWRAIFTEDLTKKRVMEEFFNNVWVVYSYEEEGFYGGYTLPGHFPIWTNDESKVTPFAAYELADNVCKSLWSAQCEVLQIKLKEEKTIG